MHEEKREKQTQGKEEDQDEGRIKNISNKD